MHKLFFSEENAMKKLIIVVVCLVGGLAGLQLLAGDGSMKKQETIKSKAMLGEKK